MREILDEGPYRLADAILSVLVIGAQRRRVDLQAGFFELRVSVEFPLHSGPEVAAGQTKAINTDLPL